MPHKHRVAYLDWAGVPGPSLATRTSDWLVVAVAVVADAHSLDTHFRNLHIHLSLRPTDEFHFSKLPDWIRAEFFRAAQEWEFEAAAIVVRKSGEAQRVSVKGVRLLGNSVAALIDRFSPAKLEGTLFFVDAPRDDAPEVREIGNRIRQALRRAGLTGWIQLRGRPAHALNGLQLADMLAGGVLRRETGEKDFVSGLGEKLKVFRS